MSAENDDPRPQPQYDEDEAKQILAGHIESLTGTTSSDRLEAAKRLFSETAALCRDLGYQVKHTDTLELRTREGPSSPVAHAWYQEGGIVTVGTVSLRRIGEPRSLRVRFNPVTRRWEGQEEDSYRVPIPGQPRAKRSAKAVLAEALVAALSEQPQEQRSASLPTTGYSTR